MDLDLRAIYRPPTQTVLDKATDRVGPAAAGFVARATLAVVASTDGAGVDASPRGGPPGFVRVLDEHTLAFGDLTGNNRLDTYANLQTVDAVGILLIVPGAEETLRVNGRARLSIDDSVRATCAIDGRVPRVAVIVEVDECYLHCGAALRRAGLWDVESWSEPDERPSAGEILCEAVDLPVPASTVDEQLASYYDEGIWEVGGADT